MAITGEDNSMNPFIIALMMIVAFFFAVRPASAGGAPAAMQGGVGGSSIIDPNMPVPTVMNKETLSSLSERGISTDDVSQTRGIVMGKTSDSITVQTFTGSRTLALHEDSVFKEDGKVVSFDAIGQGDLVTLTTDNRGNALNITKTGGIPGNLQGILALSALSTVGAGLATTTYLHWHRRAQFHQLSPQQRYLLQ